jgi:hypothetical protein
MMGYVTYHTTVQGLEKLNIELKFVFLSILNTAEYLLKLVTQRMPKVDAVTYI